MSDLIHVMPWGPLRIEVRGAPPGYTHRAAVIYDHVRKQWTIDVELRAPPEQRHWAQGES